MLKIFLIIDRGEGGNMEPVDFMEPPPNILKRLSCIL